MSALYEAIGRAVVGLIVRRYRRQLQVAAAIGVAGAAAVAFIAATREVEEG